MSYVQELLHLHADWALNQPPQLLHLLCHLLLLLLHILYQILNILYLLLKHLETHNLLLLLSSLLPEISANSTLILGFFGGAPLGFSSILEVCVLSLR